MIPRRFAVIVALALVVVSAPAHIASACTECKHLSGTSCACLGKIDDRGCWYYDCNCCVA